MKGIVLAGGAGTRLHPMTLAISKQMLPVYDRPMIYFPVAALMHGGVRDVLIISTPLDLPGFKRLLGDGSEWGMRFSYAEQPSPDGIAQALLIGAEFIAGDSVALVLGDNIFHGGRLADAMRTASLQEEGATVFGYRVADPSRFGIVSFDPEDRVIGIDEKPVAPRSNWAVTGLYIYDGKAAEIARGIRTSSRGELEITDVNRAYLEMGQLRVERMGRGMAWLDSGTPDSLMEAAAYVRALENRQGERILCPEVIAFENGYISRDQLAELGQRLGKSDYGRYLLRVAEEQGRGPRGSENGGAHAGK